MAWKLWREPDRAGKKQPHLFLPKGRKVIKFKWKWILK